MRPLDTVCLEVLTDGSKELFASPGDRKFREQPPISYVGSGLLGNGIFGLYLHDIVLADNVTHEYKGESEVGGRRFARFDYRVPRMWSGQTIRTEEGSGVVSLEGSYWADLETYDVVRLQLNAADFPPTLPVAEMTTSIDYAQTRLRHGLVALLPQSAEVRLVKSSGEVRHNRIGFTQCREFGAESTIDFGSSESAERSPRFSVASVDDVMRSLPGGLHIAVKLRSQISDRMAVGALIDGVIATNVTARKGAVLIPAGSPVRGRLRRLERYTEPAPHFIVGLEFTEVEVRGIRHRFDADLLGIESAPGIERTLSSSSSAEFWDLDRGGQGVKETKETLWLPSLPGVATFFLRGSKLELPGDFRTVWKTRKPPQ